MMSSHVSPSTSPSHSWLESHGFRQEGLEHFNPEDIHVVVEVSSDNKLVFEDSEKPLILDRFEHKQQIGSGKSAKVSLVFDTLMKMDCVLKQPKGAIKQQSICQLIKDEGNLTQSIPEHPFIVKTYSLLESVDGRPIIVMEYAGQKRLSECFSEDGRLDSSMNLSLVIAQLVLALEHLHYHQIIHRDINFDNIVVGDDGFVKLVDFGIAKKLAKGEERKSVIGTPCFMAPEMLELKDPRCNNGYSYSVDWWGLGCLAYQMSTGKVPFGENFLQEKERGDITLLGLKKCIEGEHLIFPEDFDKKQGNSQHLQDLISKLLEKDPDCRMVGLENIKQHPYFQDINWEGLSKKDMNNLFKKNSSCVIL